MIFFAGDPHGDLASIIATALAHRPDALVLLGDIDASRPLEQEMAAVVAEGIQVRYIPGNHDGDRPERYAALYGGAAAAWSLHDRVELLGATGNVAGNHKGLAVAGLGGVFRDQVWNPNCVGPPARTCRREMLAACRSGSKLVKYRLPWEPQPGLPLRHRVSIWPEDYQHLMGLRADVLVTHEAPSCHKDGYAVLDRLAEAMGVKLVVHGHHHEDYQDRLPSGITVLGVGLTGVVDETGRRIALGKPPRRRQRS